jgi:hypothetical protein
LIATQKEQQMRLKKLVSMTAAAALAVFSAVAPVRAGEGPTSGVGGDGFTRFLWYGTDGRILIEKCNATLAGCTQQIYGPVPTWIPTAYCVTNSNDSYVLWRNTTGLVAIWRLDVNLGFINAALYQGPQAQGWEAYSLSCDTLPASTQRLLWKNTSGSVAVWIINRDLSLGTQVEFTQPFGWYGTAASPNTATGEASNAKAMDAMTNMTPQ